MKQTIKITVLAVLIISLLLSINACGKKESSDSTTPPATTDTGAAPAQTDEPPAEPAGNSGVRDSVTIALTQDSGTLDPSIIGGYDMVYAVNLIYDPLWYSDENLESVYLLAESVEKLDSTHYRVHLREGVTFSNGNTFDADDVLYSLNRYCNREGLPSMIEQLDLDNCTISDPYTIDLAFLSFRVNLLAPIGDLAMFDKETCEADPDALALRPVGTGPYTLKSYVVNSHLTLERKDDYWGKKGAMKTFEFVLLTEEAQRVNSVETGEVDIAEIPYQEVSYIEEMPGIRINSSPAFLASGIFFNIAESSVFYNNPDARRAVSYAIDRDAINNIVYSGRGYKATSAIQQSGHALDWDPRMDNIGIYGSDYDPELAKQLAESSGLTGKNIRLINSGAASEILMSELIQNDCKKAGITVQILSYDSGTWVSVLFDETAYDINIGGLPLAGESASTTLWASYGFMAASSYTNYTYPGHDEAIELIDKVTSTEDVEERKAIHYRLTEIAVDQMLWYLIVTPTSAYAMPEGLQGEIRRAADNQVTLYRNLYWE